MGEIYSSSVLTIVAASALDANSPLHGVRPGAGFYEHPVLVYDKRKIDAMPITSLQLLAISKYEQRAWTFQERLTSNRCVVSGDYEVVYFCDHGDEKSFHHNERTQDVDRVKLDRVADQRLRGLHIHKTDTKRNISFQLTELLNFYSSRQTTFSIE